MSNRCRLHVQPNCCFEHGLLRCSNGSTKSRRSQISDVQSFNPSSQLTPLPHSPIFKSRASFDANPSTNQIFQADIQHPDAERFFSVRHGVLDPQGVIHISWLCVLSVTFWYNAWVIPLRSSFPFQTPDNSNVWLMMDGCADLIYLLDIIFVKHRIMYLHEGFWVRDPKLTRRNYMKKMKFKVSYL